MLTLPYPCLSIWYYYNQSINYYYMTLLMICILGPLQDMKSMVLYVR